MAGLNFDDLIPANPAGDKKSKLTFDDLIIGKKPVDTSNQPVNVPTVFTDEMLFGLPMKATNGVQALMQRGLAALPGESPWEGQTVGDLYDTNRKEYQASREQYADQNPVKNTAASIAGSIYGGAVLGGAAGNVIGRGAQALSSSAPSIAPAVNWAGDVLGTYGGRMASTGAGGAAQGGLSAYGHDQDIGTGMLVGGATGLLARPVIDAGGALVSSVGGLVGLGNQTRANSAITNALTRSGQSADDVANDIATAAAQGQPEYTVADAIGNSGQRMLTGVARSPGDMRQQIAEQLQRRQAGQGRRIQNALVEGFGTPQTAEQTQQALTALRRADANVNYTAARQGAGTVDPTGAISRADDFLGTAGSLSRTNIADDSVEGAVRRARSFLTDGDNIVSDFDTAFRAKVELDNMIESGSPTIQGRLIPIRDELDRALERSSDVYANARDTFRRQSQDISAADVGREAAMRDRVEDTIPRFQSMTRPEQQASFRAGYVDPYIADVQKATGPMTNKARPLISDATAAEFPAFAAPGQGPQLMDRIAREQRMFETTNAALGGSRTADNAADMADVQSFDPTMLGMIATGQFKSAALRGLQTGINTIQGRNTATRDAIARMLLENDPQAARDALRGAVNSGNNTRRVREALIRAMTSSGATALPKIQSY
ncbi:MAG: hypothetical protein AAAB13_20535 [Pseudomonas sp.]